MESVMEGLYGALYKQTPIFVEWKKETELMKYSINEQTYQKSGCILATFE